MELDARRIEMVEPQIEKLFVLFPGRLVYVFQWCKEKQAEEPTILACMEHIFSCGWQPWRLHFSIARGMGCSDGVIRYYDL